ncbi:hypothetical protein A3A20_00845 [Candidatus Wolfebacteria bacterium RIFCSPLOWO2_01_FULL_45_19]|uniref:Uncharacterized protein n=1 Tax=Candidatus Wolfebacteria bacterium RIFCSPLOWO2_01_FULL_45_19 TaxID=1802557 RepID=A0A1F8DPU1_9BACT|nr:MAG: hypothetical protein A3A20_00845 [Candidatus Wolfebacteria bacterium RIFCSPLOWO2_01_FULL_45_19]
MQKGFAVLPIILLVSVLIFEVAAAGIFILYISQQTGSTLRRQVEALAAAEAGIHDVLIRSIRDKNFPTPEVPYDITAGDWAVTITVVKNGDERAVTSSARAFSRGKTLKAILTVASSTGQVTIDSVVEL